MGRKCSAFGCTSGYDSAKGKSANQLITMHSYPLKDKELCEKWIRATHREDFQPTKNSGLCSLHFRESDFVEYSQDTNSTRIKEAKERPLCRRYLKKDAVPSVFPNAPAYLSTNPSERRPTTKATAACRLEEERRKLESLETSFVAKDDLTLRSLADIRDKLLSEDALPGGFQITIMDNRLLIYKMDIINEVACIRACITIRPNLEVLVTASGKVIPESHYKDTCPPSLQSLSQLLNLMALVKSWCEEKQKNSRKLLLTLIEQHIEDYVETFEACDNERRQLEFILEQLKLIGKSKYARHYSPQQLIFAYMIYASSPSAYGVFLDQNLLCLPSVSTLKKITRRLDTNTGMDTAGYLKLRVSKINQFQKTVLLIIDEIYIAKRVEYSAGGVQGLTEDCRVASTLLCFMVKSLAGKYKDLVAIYPMSNLTADKQSKCYKEVMNLLQGISLDVVAISVDNASTNRKFFTDFLCEGNLKTHVNDPITNKPVFLIFDPVHDLKNVYNNFQSRKSFDCPPFSVTEGASEGCHARFQHIVDLYNKESVMALKMAYKLNPSVLEPKNIEKTSVRLAVSVFCESTRDALMYYSKEEGLTGWASTSDFLSMIMKLWNVMNVKSPFKGLHKRNISMDPVRSSADWKLQYLRDFAEFLTRWESSRLPGLTKETFLALRHTCKSLADCASHLLDNLGFSYVLLGNLQSDAIESRFGWLRQLSGANYYISMRQVLESDRKIRTVSLLKYSKASLSDIDEVIHCESSGCQSDTNILADAIAGALALNLEPTSSDANIIFYISGAIARSTVRATKCDFCKESLISEDTPEHAEMEDSAQREAEEFLTGINRGGLLKPSNFTFMLAMHCWRVFEELRCNANLMAQFLKCSAQRSLFLKLMDRATYNERFSHLLFGTDLCSGGHNIKEQVIGRFFNCMAKNLVKDLTIKANPKHEPEAKRRKIAKLSGAKQ